MLRWLISTIGLAALKGEASAIARRLARRAIVFALALLLCLIALGFGLAMLTVWLASALGPIAACAIVGGALLLVGIALFLGLALTRRRHDGRTGLGAMPNVGGAELTGLASIAIIALTGYLLGRQIFRR